jgi:hypothetical protein
MGGVCTLHTSDVNGYDVGEGRLARDAPFAHDEDEVAFAEHRVDAVVPHVTPAFAICRMAAMRPVSPSATRGVRWM